MCVKQNVIDFGSEYPHAAKQVETSFYVDDYLGGADSSPKYVAVELHGEMHNLFQIKGVGFCYGNGMLVTKPC